MQKFFKIAIIVKPDNRTTLLEILSETSKKKKLIRSPVGALLFSVFNNKKKSHGSQADLKLVL